MKRLLAIFILAGFVAATAIAQQSSGTQSQHVSHGDSVNSAQTQTDNTVAGTNQSSKKKKKTENKKPQKTKSQKTTSAPPQ